MSRNLMHFLYEKKCDFEWNSMSVRTKVTTKRVTNITKNRKLRAFI